MLLNEIRPLALKANEAWSVEQPYLLALLRQRDTRALNGIVIRQQQLRPVQYRGI